LRCESQGAASLAIAVVRRVAVGVQSGEQVDARGGDVVGGGGTGESAEDAVDGLDGVVPEASRNLLDHFADGIGVCRGRVTVRNGNGCDRQDRVEGRAAGGRTRCEEAGVLDAPNRLGAGQVQEFDQVLLRCGQLHGVVESTLFDLGDDSRIEVVESAAEAFDGS
jgi:hypothetical protein